MKEIEQATEDALIPYEESDENISPQSEEEIDESDSCPSCDNFELDEFKENFNELLEDDDTINDFFSDEEKLQERKTVRLIKPLTSDLTIVKELPSQH